MTAHGKAKTLFITILAALSQRAVAEDWTQKLLFHGTSLILRPDYSTHEAANHTATAANFYSYFGQTGYISFGWSVGTILSSGRRLTVGCRWLPATADADSTPCHPDNEVCFPRSTVLVRRVSY